MSRGNNEYKTQTLIHFFPKKKLDSFQFLRLVVAGLYCLCSSQDVRGALADQAMSHPVCTVRMSPAPPSGDGGYCTASSRVWVNLLTEVNSDGVFFFSSPHSQDRACVHLKPIKTSPSVWRWYETTSISCHVPSSGVDWGHKSSQLSPAPLPACLSLDPWSPEWTGGNPHHVSRRCGYRRRGFLFLFLFFLYYSNAAVPIKRVPACVR